MKLVAINADLVKMKTDAIVNPANNALAAGGVSGIIFAAAGTDLIEYIQEHHPLGCGTGCVKVTPGFNLPAKFILHTVGPDMRLYKQHDASHLPTKCIGDYLGDLLLMACYHNCMRTAIDEGLTSIAFPAISTGIFGFNKKRAAHIAVDNLTDNFASSDIEVTFACFGDEDTAIVQAAIDDRDEQDHHLTWSMYLDTSPEDIEDWVLDLDAQGAPDGTYDVVHNYLREQVGISHGVTVKDGKFVEAPTLRACAEARNRSGYWGTFLEALKWIPDESRFEAHFGS